MPLHRALVALTAGAPVPAPAPAPVALVLRALGLGDLLTAVPALRALARGLPDHHVVLATTPGVAPLARAAGLAGAVVGVAELGPPPVRGPVDLTVNLHGRGPQSHRRLAEVPARRRWGFDLPGGPAWAPDGHEVARWASLVEGAGLPCAPDDLDLAGVAPSPAVPRGATVVHPGAAAEARRWPARRWAAVARREADAGRAVVVTGSAGERPLAAAVCRWAGLPPTANLAGRTDVVELAGVVAASARVLSADTGIAHLAVALRRPSVTVFGPTSPARWGPPADRPWHRVRWAGRVGDPHGADPHPGLLAVTVPEVLAELAELDAQADPAPGLAVPRAG